MKFAHTFTHSNFEIKETFTMYLQLYRDGSLTLNGVTVQEDNLDEKVEESVKAWEAKTQEKFNTFKSKAGLLRKLEQQGWELLQ